MSIPKEMVIERQACLKDAFAKDPEIPTMTLAKQLVKSHGGLFPDVESTRSCIRYYRGETGARDRGAKIYSSDKRKIGTPIGNIVPKSDKHPIPTDPVKVKLHGHGTVLSDLHIPYHDENAVRVALEHSEKNNAMDFLFINGDFLDFYQASRWERNPRARDLDGELEMGREFLAELAGRYKQVIYKLANHEGRFDKYIYANAPVLAGIKRLTLASLLDVEELGIQLIGAQQVAHVGKHLTILHGHEFSGAANSPVNPARGAFMKAKDNVMVGHHHKPSEHVETNIRGKVVSAFSLGCLCKLNPPYAPVNGYVHGFANMHVDGNDFEVANYRLTDKYKVR